MRFIGAESEDMPPILLAVDKTYPKGLDVVSPRPARRRQRGALPRAAQLPAGGVRVRVRHARSSTPLPRARPARGVHPRIAGRARRRAARARRRPDRAACGGARTRSPRWRARSTCRPCSPTATTSPHALARDAQVLGALANAGIAFHTYKDHAIFERDEVLTRPAQPYTVFTPYKRAWLAKVDAFYLKPYPVARLRRRAGAAARPARAGADAGRHRLRADQPRPSWRSRPAARAARALFDDFFERIDRYDDARDFPAVRGPELPGVHLRFGTVSIRAARRRRAPAVAAGRRGRGDLAQRTDLARLLLPDPRAPSARAERQRSFRPEYDKIQLAPRQACRRRCSTPGARAAPAIRWSTPPWRRSTRPATCTTACAWWWRASCARTWASTGAAASATSPST